MNNAAKEVNDMLSDTSITAITNGKHFWGLADEKTQEPFITYKIRENSEATKDRSGDYDVDIYIWEKGLTKAGIIYDKIKTVARSLNFRYRGGESDYTDGEARTAYIRMGFNIKIRL